MQKKRVLILYNKIFHYRIPIWNILAQQYDLTVAYSEKATDEEIARCAFKTMYIPMVSIGKVRIHKRNLFRLAKQYDVVVTIGQVAWLSYSMLSLFKRSYRLLVWGIGAPASYHRHYGEASKFYYAITDFFQRGADGQIFYADEPIQMHLDRGYDRSKLFVAHNTVEVIPTTYSSANRHSLLFIGSLYREKGLGVLLDAYNRAYQRHREIPLLQIVGGGSEFGQIAQWIQDHQLQDRIILLGPIYNSEQKKELFLQSIACISPAQAGLSVLESMGYGVPYITSLNAITGGEAFNIIHQENGLRYDQSVDLADILVDIALHPAKYYGYGARAYEHYWAKRTPRMMANGIIEAIESNT